MKRHDAGDYASSPGPLFDQPAEGPFDRSKLRPTALEATVAGLIWQHQGRENPISIARLKTATGLDERTIKGVVASLIDAHKMRIGASREEPVGYFIMRDGEDVQAGTGAYWAQFISMGRRLRILDPDRMPELFGQLTLEERD